MKLTEYIQLNYYKVKGLVVKINTSDYEVGEHKILEVGEYDRVPRFAEYVYGTGDIVYSNSYTVDESYTDFIINDDIKKMHGDEVVISEYYDRKVTVRMVNGIERRFPTCLLDVIINEVEVNSDIYDGEAIEPSKGIMIEYYDYDTPTRDYIRLDDARSRSNFTDVFQTCNDCGHLVLLCDDTSNTIDTTYGRVCQACIDNRYSMCDSCERYYRNSDFVNDLCYRCDEDNRSINTRNFGDKIVSSELGKVQSHRTFGVEIECDMAGNTSSIIPKECGIVEDGSVDGDDPYELVTPPLGGKAGEEWLKNLSHSLTSNGVRINKSCGLHVHLIAEDFKDKYVKLRNLVLFYHAVESVIFSMVPYSRRFNNYCRRIKQVIDIDKVIGVYSLEAFEKAFYGIGDRREIERTKRGKYSEKRYAFLNIHNLFFSGKTVEIRNHSGTTQSDKIIPWVNFHALILDYIAKAKTVEVNRVVKKLQSKDLASKTDMLLELIGINDEHSSYLKSRQKKFTPDMNDPFITDRRGASDEDDELELSDFNY